MLPPLTTIACHAKPAQKFRENRVFYVRIRRSRGGRFCETAIWFAGGIGRRVIWRGEEFVLFQDGRMRHRAGAAGCREVGRDAVRVT